MTKIAYILGAGASYSAIPIVGEMEERMFNIYNALCNDIYEENVEEVGSDKPGFLKWRHHKNINKLKEIKKSLGHFEKQDLIELCSDLHFLYAGTSNHSSVDTFARKMWLRGEEAGLRRLKHMLSIYILLEQMINPLDKRYDKFFATVLEKKEKSLALPKNISIFSWNYDLQLENTLKNYFESEVNFRKEMNLGVKNTVLDVNKPAFSQELTSFAISKINGSAGFINDNEIEYVINELPEPGKDLEEAFRKILAKYKELSGAGFSPKSAISFAWEEESLKGIELNGDLIYYANMRCKESRNIVLIGYSLPYFNNKIDKRLLGGLDANTKFYIQDPNPEKVIKALKETTTFKENLDFEIIKDQSEFFIPYDFFGS